MLQMQLLEVALEIDLALQEHKLRLKLDEQCADLRGRRRRRHGASCAASRACSTRRAHREELGRE